MGNETIDTLDFAMFDAPEATTATREERESNLDAVFHDMATRYAASQKTKAQLAVVEAKREDAYSRVVNIGNGDRVAVYFRTAGAKRWSKWCGRVVRHSAAERAAIEACLARHSSALLALTTECPEASWDPCKSVAA